MDILLSIRGGLVGTKDPPPHFWVEKFKKIGIRVIGDGGGSL